VYAVPARHKKSPREAGLLNDNERFPLVRATATMAAAATFGCAFVVFFIGWFLWCITHGLLLLNIVCACYELAHISYTTDIGN
jgi:hypothetical protein